MIPAATLLTLIALFASACGGSGPDPAPPSEPATQEAPEVAGDADPADVQVIDDWSSSLREGDVEAAAEFFAIPSTAENGLTYDIRSEADARLFNESLPCGAELIEAQSEGEFTTATFELTERPGPGACGDGAGNEAQTTFVIEDGKIAEWRRVVLDETQPAPGEAA